MAEIREAKSGICYQDSKLVCGVPEQQDYCDEGTWEPPFIVADGTTNGGHPNRICAYYPHQVQIGRCGPNADGTPGICSNLASRCDDPIAFVARDSTCSITHDSLFAAAGDGAEVQWPTYMSEDSSPFSRWTTYGSCDGRCVWSPGDCADGEVYARDDPACTADKVGIGACFDGYAYCVVSEDNCKTLSGRTEPYYSHEKLLELEINCHLANLPKLINPHAQSPPTSKPTASVADDYGGGSDNAASPVDETPESENASAKMPVDEAPESENAVLSKGAIIGLCVGGAALAFAATLGIHSYVRRKRRLDADWGAAKEAPPPAKSIKIDAAGDASDADEAVSVL